MKEKTSEKIGIIGVFLLLFIFIGGIVFIIVSKYEKISVKTTQITNISEGDVVTDKEINLNEYATNISIKEGGEYKLTGTLKSSLIINTTADVTLNLDNVKISSTTSAAIINKGTNTLNINMLENTENTLSDGGKSSYDAVIFSNSNIIIDGAGKLSITSNQNNGKGIEAKSSNITINNGRIIITSNDDGINTSENGGTITINKGTIFIDAKTDGMDSNKDIIINDGELFVMSEEGKHSGIDADLGLTINGGTLIALGNDILEYPLDTSKQYSMSFKLDETINASSIVSLKNNNEEIITFKSTKKFNNLIISTPKLTKGTYKLYKDGTDVANISNGIYKEKKYKDGSLVGKYKLNSVIGKYGE